MSCIRISIEMIMDIVFVKIKWVSYKNVIFRTVAAFARVAIVTNVSQFMSVE